MTTQETIPVPGTNMPIVARAFAILRAAVLVLFSVALIAVPEKVLPGSSAEPARTLALNFASRTITLGVAFLVLAFSRHRKALAWVFLADAALQVFDTGMAVAMGKGAVAALPVAIGVLDAWAGIYLLGRSRK